VIDHHVEKVIRQTFELGPDEPLDETMTSDDIPGWDSLGHLNLTMALQKEFDIKFEVEEIFEISSIGDIERILGAKGVVQFAVDLL
jgi:acyl carrier protein